MQIGPQARVPTLQQHSIYCHTKENIKTFGLKIGSVDENMLVCKRP